MQSTEDNVTDALPLRRRGIGALFWATRGLGLDGKAAVTISFLILAFGQLWHVFNL